MRGINIKHILAYFLIIFLVSVSIFIVYKRFAINKSVNIFEDAVFNLSVVNNYSFNQTLNINYDKKISKVDFVKKVSGKIDEENLRYNYLYDNNSNIYGNVIDNNNYVYIKSKNDSWEAVKSDNEMFSLRKLGLFLSNKKNIKQVKSDDNSLIKYEVISSTKVLKKYVFRENMNIINQLDILDDNTDLIIYVYVDKDKNVSKIVFDLNNYLKKSQEKNKMINKVLLSIEINDINAVSQVIPEEIINSDINYEKSNPETNMYTEEQIMYDIILSATVYCKEGTIDFANYKNQLNDYLQLNEYNIDFIKEGIIKIDKDCNVEVKKDFIINGKICTFDDENYENCK